MNARLLRDPMLATALVVAAACSSDPKPVQMSAFLPQTQTPPEPVSVNGRYDTLAVLARGNALSCGTQRQMTIEVRNETLTYTMEQPQVRYRPRIDFKASVASDGTFLSVVGPNAMRGTISSGHMSGDIRGDACGYTFEADRTGTW